MIVTMFPELREQARAIGVYSFVASAGASIGLLAGGAIMEAIIWHWIFFVNRGGSGGRGRAGERSRPIGGCLAARAESGDVERHRRGRRREGGRPRAPG